MSSVTKPIFSLETPHYYAVGSADNQCILPAHRSIMFFQYSYRAAGQTGLDQASQTDKKAGP